MVLILELLGWVLAASHTRNPSLEEVLESSRERDDSPPHQSDRPLALAKKRGMEERRKEWRIYFNLMLLPNLQQQLVEWFLDIL